MEIKTEQGLAEPMPQTDLQRNNRILIWFAILLTIITMLVVYVVWKVIRYNVIGNILKQGIC